MTDFQEVPEGRGRIPFSGTTFLRGRPPSGTPSGSAPTPDALTPTTSSSEVPRDGGQGSSSDVFDIYCSECFGPFARWRTVHGRNLCDECAILVPVLCESCSIRLAAVIVDGYKVCGRCANQGRRP